MVMLLKMCKRNVYNASAYCLDKYYDWSENLRLGSKQADTKKVEEKQAKPKVLKGMCEGRGDRILANVTYRS